MNNLTKEEEKKLKELQEQCLKQFEINVKEGKLDNPNLKEDKNVPKSN